ncbi:MAG: AAA family ATPase, partial [Gemmatimonadota bacterium]
VRRKLDLVLDFPISLTEFSAGHLDDLRERAADLVLLDVEGDPELGCRLAEMISESGAARRIVAVGPGQSPDFLLQAMQSGVADYLTKPLEKPALLASIERARRGMVAQPGAARKAGRIYVFYSPKGGGGSTTIATNLSIQLHRLTGERTVLVDLNLELGEVAAFLGLEPRYDFADLARNLHRMDAGLLASYLTRHETGIDVLAAPYRPQMADGLTDDQVLQVLRLLRQHYNFVIIDSPKALTPRTVHTLEAADGVFIVAQTNVPTIQNIQRSLGLFEHLTQGGKAVRLIVNRHQKTGDITLADLERAVEMDVYWTIPNDYAAFSYSMNTGKPLTMNEDSATARELGGLAARVAGLTAEESARPAGRLGNLLGRLREKMPGSPRGSEVRLVQHPHVEGETA